MKEERIGIIELREIKQLGIRIKELRKNLELSLPELAEKTGLSASYLSRVERGVSSPSLESLAILAKTFGQTIANLFGSKPEIQPCIEKTGLGSGDAPANLLAEFLNGNPKIQITLCTLNAKTSFPQKHTHNGEEVVYILNGQAEIELENEKRILNKGNSFGFPGNTPHNIWNPSDSATRLLIATVSPDHYLIKRD